jgi:hypothetical protein
VHRKRCGRATVPKGRSGDGQGRTGREEDQRLATLLVERNGIVATRDPFPHLEGQTNAECRSASSPTTPAGTSREPTARGRTEENILGCSLTSKTPWRSLRPSHEERRKLQPRIDFDRRVSVPRGACAKRAKGFRPNRWLHRKVTGSRPHRGQASKKAHPAARSSTAPRRAPKCESSRISLAAANQPDEKGSRRHP